MVGVVIVAAGRSERMGSAMPKPLLDLGGRTMLQRSVALFDNHPEVRELVVVLPADWVEAAPRLVGATRHVCRFVAGGPARHDSVRAGCAELSDEIDLVLVHDAARPFADRALVDRVLAAAREAGAALPAVPARDTVKRVDLSHRTVRATLPRSEIWLAQTPQGFRRAVLDSAVRSGVADATDEAMIVERQGLPVRVVDGDERNVKITTPEDLAAARARLTAASMRVGTGYDLHRLVEGRALVLGGVAIPFDRGPRAHSDGDVVCHALIDAMLGAAGAGDIGQLFPDTDPQWRDAAGLDLLARALAVVADHGLSVASVDVTVLLERPKLAPHVPAIRQRIAEVLGLPPGQVGLKGKTNEGVDAVGRGEAIAAHAVAVLAWRGLS